MNTPRNKHILVIEDDEDVQELLRYNLVRAGYRVTSSARGEHGLRLAMTENPDLILLDIMLPGMSGLEVCRQLRREPKTALLPIIMVTAKNDESDIVTGLELGADDYVTKPFSVNVLLSRVHAALRVPVSREYDPGSDIRVAELLISPRRHRVEFEGKHVPELTVTEFRLLHFLASRPGWVFNRQQILDAVRGEDAFVTERAVDVQMVGLRKKLGPRRNFIEAVRGVGYRFRG